MYDVIVVGARCAGSPTAMLLARQGCRVLLVDRATFPSDTMSTHFIHNKGVAQLQRWGLRERLAATGCPPVTRLTLDFGPIVLTGSPIPAGDTAMGYAPRRRVLDKLLVEAAVEAGVELRQEFVVEELVHDGERVSGIRGHARGGGNVTEEARIVVGADGLHSLVARGVAAPAYHEQPPLTCFYYSYWSGVPLDRAELYLREGRVVIVFPTHADLACVVAIWPNDEFHAFRADIEGNFLKTLEIAPALADRLRAGQREERFMGTADLPNFFRRPYGPGWALVGDAGYHKDPLLAQGISDAFHDAELLAEAITSGLSGREALDEALAEYERQRNERVTGLYHLTLQRAALQPPPPEMVAFLAALPGQQVEIDRLLGVDAGTGEHPAHHGGSDRVR